MKGKIIQNFIWDHHISKIDRFNPFEVSKFEKEIKKMCYQIKDETLKKYVIEDFLDKIKKLTPIQSANRTFGRYKNFNKKNYEVLNETKNLHEKKIIFQKFKLKNFLCYSLC